MAGYRGEVDADVLAFVREVRAAGVRVGLGTNATDLLDTDLAELGLVGELDVVVNSSVVGVHKPAKEYFQAACEPLETPPARCSSSTTRTGRSAGSPGGGAVGVPVERAAGALPAGRAGC